MTRLGEHLCFEAEGRLREFGDAGRHGFRLSGCLHDDEARRFKQLVRPPMAARNPDRLSA